MPDAFHEVQFPTDISHGSIGGPEFKTEVVELSSAFEKRNILWTYPRERWEVAYGVTTQTLLDTLRHFFYARKGRAIGFRFKNHDDYEGTDEELGEGDGSTVAFQLVKIYSSGSETFTRKITKPVSGMIYVYVDSALQSDPADYSIDLTTGIITFTSAPTSGEVITATFEFDIPARFDTDYLPVVLASYEARSANVPVVEIRV